MLELGPLSFAAPWLLVALIAVPAIFWLLRVTPPSPRRVPFPALRLLLGLPRTAEEPMRTPLWLLLLRAALALLVILALAGPIIRGEGGKAAATPLLIAIDDGWASADDWPRRKRILIALIDKAARQNVPVALLTTAPRGAETSGPPERLPASDARARIEALDPVPWPVDRENAAKRLAAASWRAGARVIWLSDGLDSPGSAALRQALSDRGTLTVTEPRLGPPPVLLLPPEAQANGLKQMLRRADGRGVLTGTLHARTGSGQAVAEALFRFEPGQTETSALFEGPQTLFNDIARIEIDGRRSAGAVTLIDDSHRKHNVGLIADGTSEESQPLLSDLFYLERALSPFATVTRGSIATLARPERTLIMLADVGHIAASEHEALTRWIEEGGTLVRFAGPRLAAQSGTPGDDLLPVPLRQGDRTLGGALSWDTPETLGAFDPEGPFAGIQTRADIHVKRQVLAEPVPDLASRTWARLADGTPLVTAAPRGKGRIVLIHVTANTDWSDLPLSGVYVDMLKRLVSLAKTPGTASSGPRAAGADELLAPLRALDAYGVLGTPPAGAEPLQTAALSSAEPGPRHPPGLYGREDAARAFNLGQPGTRLAPLRLDGGVSDESLTALQDIDLKPWLLGAALLLALGDALAAILVGGGLPALRRQGARLLKGFGVVVLGAILLAPRPSEAADDHAIAAALHSFRLAYVRTGDAEADAVSKAGLEGLSRTLAERTAVEPDKPTGVDLDADEIAFFSLLYWQVPPSQPPLSDQAIERLDRFMKTGGTLVIDTDDADRDFGGGHTGPGEARLRKLMAALDLPPLEPVPHDHVLTKSFYLIQQFPGRLANGQVWVEAARGGADHDGVATLIVGSNGWAAAWARDQNGNPLYPVTPGGEMQRERALRFGVNLVMYALTGNYKADQVHVPALLERLGQ
jgi:Domain of unknown function (DUF4159)/Aerotolerance regulator N-terminal